LFQAPSFNHPPTPAQAGAGECKYPKTLDQIPIFLIQRASAECSNFPPGRSAFTQKLTRTGWGAIQNQRSKSPDAEGKSSPKLHWRRGHVRLKACLPDESHRRTWVKSTLVGWTEFRCGRAIQFQTPAVHWLAKLSPTSRIRRKAIARISA